MKFKVIIMIMFCVILKIGSAQAWTQDELLECEQFLNWCVEEDYVRGNEVIDKQVYRIFMNLLTNEYNKGDDKNEEFETINSNGISPSIDDWNCIGIGTDRSR